MQCSFLNGTAYRSNINDQNGLEQTMKSNFEHIIADYYEILYFYGLKLVPNEERIKDELQDFFLELWEAKHLDNVTFIKAYLFSSFRRRLFHSSKKHLAHHYSDSFPVMSEPSVEDKFIAKEAYNNENYHQKLKLKRAISKLQKTQQEIIHLRYYENLDNKEIGDVLNIKYQSVRNKTSRALNKLRSLY